MFARNVCSGTLPSNVRSTRAISAPPKRPPHWTLMPRAPAFVVRCSACRMARRNAIRFSSWSTMLLATSFASSSGCFISTTLTWTCLPEASFSSRFFNSSMPAPRLPMMMPGLPVCTMTRTVLARRSISTFATAAERDMPSTRPRIARSSCTHFAYCLFSYQRESHVRVMPSRKPTGWIFCPMLFGLSVGDDDGHVRHAFLLYSGLPARARLDALERRAAVNGGLSDDEAFRPHRKIVLRVCRCRAHDLLDRFGRGKRREREHGQRPIDALAADHVHDAARFAGRYAQKARDSFRLHVISQPPCRRRCRGRGRYASVRTRRVCAPPCSPERRPGCACDRHRPRSCARPWPARPWRLATTS